jgi:hypothetical protein
MALGLGSFVEGTVEAISGVCQDQGAKGSVDWQQIRSRVEGRDCSKRPRYYNPLTRGYVGMQERNCVWEFFFLVVFFFFCVAPRGDRWGSIAVKGDAALPNLKVGGWGIVRIDMPCVCNELLSTLSERALGWDCVSTDLGTLAGTGEGSVRLAELVGDALGDDVADLVRRRGGESPQLLEGEKLLFGCSEDLRLPAVQTEDGRYLRPPAPSEGR